ncbi:MAG: MFS transporter [Proteobacteria bacterium]|nr:MFS transporter [Pseudomonadota bacterium]
MTRDPAQAKAPLSRSYLLFLAGMGSWFGAWGLQNVMFQWLVVEQLSASAERVGTAQMAILLPNLMFLLLGGAIADRIDRVRALVRLHLAASFSCAGLAALVFYGWLSYPLLIGYALLMGTLQSFVIPARDAQLSDVVDSGMSRAVAGLTMVQHGGQGIGALGAGLANLVGAPLVLGLQSLILLAGTLATRRLPRVERPPRESRAPLRLVELRAGLVEVMGSQVLRAVMLLNVSVGLVFVGSYLVILPLLVREFYGGGAARMGILAAVLPIGSIIINLGILVRGGIERKGLSLLLGQGFAGLCLGGLAFGLPFWGAALSTVGWGVGAAFAINASRTLFQEHASEANRGRVLSVYSLAILGTAPAGALLTGFLAGRVGTLETLAIHSSAMTALILATLLFTQVRRFR